MHGMTETLTEQQRRIENTVFSAIRIKAVLQGLYSNADCISQFSCFKWMTDIQIHSYNVSISATVVQL